MENQIDLMVRQVADILAQKPQPEKKQPPKAKPEIHNSVNIDGVSLEKQSGAARNAGNIALADGLLRVAELVNVPEDILLEMYRLLKPYSGAKSEYAALSARLLNEARAEKNADMVLRMMMRYEKAGQLKKN